VQEFPADKSKAAGRRPRAIRRFPIYKPLNKALSAISGWEGGAVRWVLRRSSQWPMNCSLLAGVLYRGA